MSRFTYFCRIVLGIQLCILLAAIWGTVNTLGPGPVTAGAVLASVWSNYKLIMLAEGVMAVAAVPVGLAVWLLVKFVRWATRPRPATPAESGSGSSSYSTSYRRHSHSHPHHHAAGAYAAAQASAAAAPDYFTDNSPPDNAPDYFSGNDNSYDTPSGGGGFTDTHDNSGSW